MKIYKYPMRHEPQNIELKLGAVVVSVGIDPQDIPCIWVTVPETHRTQVRRFAVVPTGVEFPEPIKVHGSFKIGTFMGHVVELP